jgi:hypothetical protein
MPIRKPQKLSARQRKKQAEAAQEQSPRVYIGRQLPLYGFAGNVPRKQPTSRKRGD